MERICFRDIPAGAGMAALWTFGASFGNFVQPSMVFRVLSRGSCIHMINTAGPVQSASFCRETCKHFSE